MVMTTMMMVIWYKKHTKRLRGRCINPTTDGAFIGNIAKPAMKHSGRGCYFCYCALLRSVEFSKRSRDATKPFLVSSLHKSAAHLQYYLERFWGGSHFQQPFLSSFPSFLPSVTCQCVTSFNLPSNAFAKKQFPNSPCYQERCWERKKRENWISYRLSLTNQRF